MVDAFSEISSWGYPFSVSKFQKHSIVASVGDGDAFFWFEWINRTDLALHVAASKASRGKWFNRHTYGGMIWTAELVGAEKIFMLAPDNKKLCDYVARLGWIKHGGLGWFTYV